MSNIILAFSLTLFAGLATGLGALIAFFTERTNKKFLSAALGFSAGVMIYVSLIEIFFKAKDALTVALGDTKGYWMTVMGFFGGMLFIAMIDKLIPKKTNPHEVKTVEDVMQAELSPKELDEANLMKVGIFTALAIGIHNFPEGIATFMSAIHDPSVGIAIAIAIAIHNIPEGIAMFVPLFLAGLRFKTFLFIICFVSLPVAIGAIIGNFIGMQYPLLWSFIISIALGIIVVVTMKEIFMEAVKHSSFSYAISLFIIGILAIWMYIKFISH